MKLVTITKRKVFVETASQGINIGTKGLVLQACKHTSTLPALPLSIAVGYTASKRVGNAVARNRAKRRLRAMMQEILRRPSSPLMAGVTYVLIGKKTTLDRPFDALIKDAVYALHQAKKQLAPAESALLRGTFPPSVIPEAVFPHELASGRKNELSGIHSSTDSAYGDMDSRSQDSSPGKAWTRLASGMTTTANHTTKSSDPSKEGTP